MTFKEWRAEAAKQLVLKGMSKKELAKELGVSYNYVVSIMCGKVRVNKGIKRISEALGIEPYNE